MTDMVLLRLNWPREILYFQGAPYAKIFIAKKYFFGKVYSINIIRYDRFRGNYLLGCLRLLYGDVQYSISTTGNLPRLSTIREIANKAHLSHSLGQQTHPPTLARAHLFSVA